MDFKVYRISIKILLSVSLLSLLFLSLPLLFQFLNQFSISKSYVFLFCNGLMVFIAKNSALPSDNSSSDQFKDLDVAALVNSHDSPEQEEEEEEEKIMIVAADSQEEDDVADGEKEWVDETEKEDEVADKEKEDEDADTEKEWVDETESEDEVADTETKEEEEEGEGSNINGVWIIEEEEQEHEEVEELNKKCEDFIRKMKAAFCSDPRHDYGYYADFDHHTAMVTVR